MTVGTLDRTQTRYHASQDAAPTIDELEADLVECERAIAALRRRQAELIDLLDRLQVNLIDGSRTMADWVTSRLDVTHRTARDLVSIARTSRSRLDQGDSFDRVVATVALRKAGAGEETATRSRGLDLVGVYRAVSAHRQLTRGHQQAGYAARYFAVQPMLDESKWRLWGELPAYEGSLVGKALGERADALTNLDTGDTEARATRMADALVAICQESGGGDGAIASSGEPIVTVFVDAKQSAPTNGEAGSWVVGGPRVGPSTLERVLCEGTVEVTAVASDGEPLAIGNASTNIPPRLRRFILYRDGDGCTIDGCTSRYRLQPHHILPRHRGGDNHPDNLTTLCWYHHHIVIHGRGLTIDPTSPPLRRRFLRTPH